MRRMRLLLIVLATALMLAAGCGGGGDEGGSEPDVTPITTDGSATTETETETEAVPEPDLEEEDVPTIAGDTSNYAYQGGFSYCDGRTVEDVSAEYAVDPPTAEGAAAAVGAQIAGATGADDQSQATAGCLAALKGG